MNKRILFTLFALLLVSAFGQFGRTTDEEDDDSRDEKYDVESNTVYPA